MLDMFPLYSAARIKADIQELETLCELISQLNLQADDPLKLSNAFKELVNLAGSKEFYPVYSKLFQYVSNLKWAREGRFNAGYVVPWISLYCALRASQPTSHLVMIANRMQRHLPAQDAQNLKLNSFGNDCQPIDSNSAEWAKLLDTVTDSNQFFKSYHNRQKRPIKKFNQNQARNPNDKKRDESMANNSPMDFNNGSSSCNATVTNSPPKLGASPLAVKKVRKTKKTKSWEIKTLGLDSLLATNEWEKHVPKAAGPDKV